jgi:4-hydroxybutyrate---CoA ligase (AMP-forming)
MGMQDLYREVMKLNMMDDNDLKKDTARAFFEKLNYMKLPEHFNWAAEIFEGMHVKEQGQKTALVWADIASGETKSFTYQEFAFRGNQCLNTLRKAGVNKGDNMYMMVPIYPETWFASFACIKGGLVAVPTATTMTQRELEFRFAAYPPDTIIADVIYTDIIDAALAIVNMKPKAKLVLGKKEGWTDYADLASEAGRSRGRQNQIERSAVLLLYLRHHRTSQTGRPYRHQLSPGAPVNLGDDRYSH